MKKEMKGKKVSVVALILNTAENNSYSKEAAREFLSAENLGVDNIVSEGLKRIKRIQMMVDAEKTETEMIASEVYKKEAEDWVDKLLKDIDYSIKDIIEQEQLSVSFRNIESLSPEDVKVILVKHFTLKFMNRDNERK